MPAVKPSVNAASGSGGIGNIESGMRLILRGTSKKSALGAAMRKLVHLCFGVIKLNSRINKITGKMLDFKDGIYRAIEAYNAM